jgi:hypothetical protein
LQSARQNRGVGITSRGIDELGLGLASLGWVTELFVGGSAATGDYIPGVSDLDLVALVAGPVDALYGITLGPTLVHLIGGTPQSAGHARHWLIDHVRTVSLLGLFLLFVIPTAFAYFAARRYAVGEWIARRGERVPNSTTRGTGHDHIRRGLTVASAGLPPAANCTAASAMTATAWDWAVDHGGTGDGFVRVLGKDGQWHGGLYRPGSFFSTYPESPAVFVQEGWQLDADGAFIAPQNGSRGAWIPCVDATVVEFLDAVPDQPDD